MAEHSSTQFRMADGTLVPVTQVTDGQWPEPTRRLAQSAREASQDAIRRPHKQGLPATFLKGKDLVSRFPDGHEEIVRRNLIP